MRRLLSLLLVVGCGKSAGREEPVREEPPGPKQPSGSGEAPSPKPDLSQQYASNNKLIVVHYPKGFEAETTGKSAVLVSGEVGSGVSVTLGFVSIAEPVSDKVDEFDRILHGAVSKALEGWVELSSGECSIGGVKGIEHVGVYVSKGIPLTRHSCQFIRHAHGYSFSFSIPQTHTEVVSEVEQIRAATEFSD
jgi:hypothetical protein